MLEERAVIELRLSPEPILRLASGITADRIRTRFAGGKGLIFHKILAHQARNLNRILTILCHNWRKIREMA